MNKSLKRAFIIGGGFGGIAAALDLERRRTPNLKIILVSNKPHFEYHAGLYRVVTGHSPLNVCIPIAEIIDGKNIEFVVDTIQSIDCQKKIAHGTSGSRHRFDYAVIALGAETAYFHIPGLKELSFGFKSITEALRLKRHLHRLFETCSSPQVSPDEKVSLLHFVVVGAGASGVELAGELAHYTKNLAKQHQVDQTLITTDLIEAASRILPAFPREFSEKVDQRLRQLGVNIFTNRPMAKEEMEQISVRGMTMKTETVIWTAGVKPHSLYHTISGFTFDKKGRVVVDEFLQAEGFPNIFVVGDGASTPYSGLAQTAIRDGKLAAANIVHSIMHNPLEKHQPKKPYYLLPVGPGWAATRVGPLAFYGFVGRFFRQLVDLRYFLSILPFRKAVTAFRSGRSLCESCDICLPGGE